MDIVSIALPIHVITVLFLIMLVLYTDHLGFSWVRGEIRILPEAHTRRMHRYVWIGLITMILSGAAMFLFEYSAYLLQTPAFYIKMAFVCALLINGIAVGTLMHVATVRPFADLSRRERLPILVSGAISSISWVGAFIAATQLGL